MPQDHREDFKFVPATGVECMAAIPLAVQILHDLANEVVEADKVKEEQSKKWAIRSAISQAWKLAFNN